MRLFRRKKTVRTALTTIWVADGFLLPESWYRWMEQSDYRPAPQHCIWEWLNSQLAVKQFDANLFAQQDLPHTDYRAIMRADPVHIVADWQGLAVADNYPTDLSHQEAQALCADIQPDLNPLGYTLHCPDPYRWYISADTIEKFDSVPTACATVDKTHSLQHLPDALNHLLNQLQINLHQHTVNQAREAQGLATVNSLWCWGANTLKTVKPVKNRAQIFSDNAEIQHYATALSIRCQPTTAYDPSSQDTQLIVLDAQCHHAPDLPKLNSVEIYHQGTCYFQHRT